MTGTWEAFARRMLAVGGWPDHLNNYVSFVSAFAGEGTKAKFNPWATTRYEPGCTNFNSVPVRNYISWEQGVKATVDTLNNGNYPEVVRLLKEASPAFYTIDAVRNSPWGTFHVADGLTPFNISAHIDRIRSHWGVWAWLPVAT